MWIHRPYWLAEFWPSWPWFISMRTVGLFFGMRLAMAGDWIPMRIGLENEPEVVRILSAICPQSVRDLSARLRATNETLGALCRTWSLFDTLTEDGKLVGYTAEWLNATIGIEGWAENLQHVGWLLIEPQSLTVINFTNWMGQSAKRRLKDAQRKKLVRKMSAKCPQSVRNAADKKRTTGEERRGESKESKRKKFCKPTIHDIQGYAQSLDYVDFDANGFWHHYEANGWRVGRNPMKSWQAAVVNWHKNSRTFANGKPNERPEPKLVFDD